MASVTAENLGQQVQRAAGSVGKVALNHAGKFLGVLIRFELAHVRGHYLWASRTGSTGCVFSVRRTSSAN